MRGLICWDLDETLGYFRPLAAEIMAEFEDAQRGFLGRLFHKLSAKPPEPEGPPLRLREGIEAALTRLGEAGFVQVVTTGSFELYANRGLERCGLRHHFAEVYGRERVWEGRGKVYAKVLEDFEAKPEQVVIVGDSFERDRSSDFPGIVMICQPDGLEEPAATLPPVIEALSSEEGFAATFERWVKETPFDGLVRRVVLDEAEVAVERWGNYRRPDSLTPVLSALKLRAAAPASES
jgi:haloacid dehalogenase-like hydrolase